MGSVKCQSRYTICPYWYSLTSDWKCQFDSIKLCAMPLSKETMVMQCTVLWSAVSAYAPEVNGSERCCGDPSRAGSGLPTSSWSSKLDWWGHEGREDCNSGIPLFTFEGKDWQKGLYYLEPLWVVSSCDWNYADEIVKECRENVHHFNNNDPYDNGYIITDCDNLRDTQYRDRVAWCYPEVVQL